jgi:hypothetical protein
MWRGEKICKRKIINKSLGDETKCASAQRKGKSDLSVAFRCKIYNFTNNEINKRLDRQSSTQ